MGKYANGQMPRSIVWIGTNADVEELMFAITQKHRPYPRGEGQEGEA